MIRVALTSTPDAVGPAAQRLADLGHRPVILACISVRPTQPQRLVEIRRLATSSDIILISSARAVDAVWSEEPMPDTPVVTVGDASAAAVRERGGVVTFAGSGDLRAVLDTIQLSGRTILYPCSSLTDHTTRQEQIEAVGARALVVTAYEVAPIPPEDEPVDVVVFASPSAVDGWVMSRSLAGLDTVAIGPTTERRLVDNGYPPTVVSDRPDLVHCADLAVSLGV